MMPKLFSIAVQGISEIVRETQQNKTPRIPQNSLIYLIYISEICGIRGVNVSFFRGNAALPVN